MKYYKLTTTAGSIYLESNNTTDLANRRFWVAFNLDVLGGELLSIKAVSMKEYLDNKGGIV